MTLLTERRKIMVTNFEQHTQPLTEKEQYHVLPSLIEVLKSRCYDRGHWLSSKNLINEVEQHYHKKTKGEYLILHDYRLRAMINYIVVKQLLPVASGSSGYWLMTTKEEFESQRESLKNRSNAILARDHGLYEMMKARFDNDGE